MAFNRPTLLEILSRVEGDIKSTLTIKNVLRRSFLGAFSRALAGIGHSLFGYLSFLEKQAFPDTATGEYLERWSSIWGVTRIPATFAEFTIDVTGTAGIIVPQGRLFRRTDGAEYVTKEEVTLDGSGDTLPMIASLSGKSSAVDIGTVISIVSPIAGLNSDGEVSSIEIESADTEIDESLQERLVDRIQNPPSGGAAPDYIQWARSVAGVTRAWVSPQALGPGTVSVFIVTDNEDPITASAPKIEEVADYIETVRPVTADVSVFTPVLFEIDMTIAIKPNTVAIRNAITQELEDLIYRDSAVVGAWQGPGVTYDGKILLSRLNEAISIALNEADHEIISINGDTTPEDVEPPTGNLAVLGDITWQTLV